MGLYDTIILEKKSLANIDERVDKYLSLIEEEEVSLQTKNLGRSLSTFLVKGGQLFYERVCSKWVDDHQPDNPFGGYLNVLSKVLEERRDNIEIYGCDLIHGDTIDFWIDFKLTFVNGRLSKVALHEYRETDNSERKKRLNERIQGLREHLNFSKTFKGKIIIKFKKILKTILRFTSARFRNIADKLDKLRFKL